MKRLVVAAIALASLRAHADDDAATGSIVFARAGALYRVDPRGRGEKLLAKLPDPKQAVRALRSDAAGKVLLADAGGTWLWMRLDGGGALAQLPCADGPAQLAEDGACVLCRASDGRAQIVNFATGKAMAIAAPPAGARLVGSGPGRKLVWADASGVWSAPPRDLEAKQQLASDAPLRGFLPSPDGTRGVGVYADTIYTDARHTKPAEVLQTFQLDGTAARRKAIKSGVAVEWSHDAGWLLVQDGANACIMRATGGQYKCWKGYTAASISPDGRFALVLGGPQKPGSGPRAPAGQKNKTKPVEDAADAPVPSGDDVAVAPPAGPLALYRARLEGAYTDAPAIVAKTVDGAAVWVP